MHAKSTICRVVLIQVSWKVSILFYQPTKKIIAVISLIYCPMYPGPTFSDQKIKLILQDV